MQRKIQMEVNDGKFEEKYEAFFNAVDKEVKEFQNVRDQMQGKLDDAEKVSVIFARIRYVIL